MGETVEGQAYEKRFSQSVGAPLQAALRECAKNASEQFKVQLVFVIGADGNVQRILPGPNQTVSACVADKLKSIQLPAPPKADWMVSVNISVKE